MHDDTAHLVKMANEISFFFRMRPEEQAIAGTADHIRKFWDPRMRAAIVAHLERGGEGLDETVMRAVERLKQLV